MKKYILAILLCHLASVALAQNGGSNMSNKWFAGQNFDALEIKYFDTAKDSRASTATFKITDTESIKNLVRRIEAIPAQGPEFRSFIPKEQIEMSFTSGESKDVIRLYDGHFKTPSTGFNVTKEAESLENAIYKDLLYLSAPALGQNLLRVAGHPYNFADFSVTYEGREFFDHAPVTVSGQRDIFIIKSDGAEVKAVITSGQLPPQPYAFVAGKKSYVLQTYKTNIGKYVEDCHFIVEEKK